LAQHLNLAPTEKIQWLSPLAGDDYAEYRDEAFLQRLGVAPKIPLKTFWPARGPQWDALGRTTSGTALLVQAKAHIPELPSPPTKAAAKTSLALIASSLDQVKKTIGCGSSHDWAHLYYQYTNRLAHLYYLRTLNKLPAYLVFVYFVNDINIG